MVAVPAAMTMEPVLKVVMPMRAPHMIRALIKVINMPLARPALTVLISQRFHYGSRSKVNMILQRLNCIPIPGR